MVDTSKYNEYTTCKGKDYTITMDSIDDNSIVLKLHNNTSKILTIKIKASYYITKGGEQIPIMPLNYGTSSVYGLTVYPSLFQKITYIIADRIKSTFNEELIILETEVEKEKSMLATFIGN